MSVSTNSERLHFEPYEWAIIGLLKQVRDELIGPKINRWIKVLENDRGKDKEILRWNLASAFLNVWGMLDDEETKGDLEKNLRCHSGIDPSRYLWPEELRKFPIACLKELLATKGYLLFNSYYYVVMEAFGEKNLVPLSPGFDPTKNNQEHFHKALRHFDNLQLPFRLYNREEYALSYSSQLLPFKGGVSPHYVHTRMLSADRNGETRAHNIKDFLGDLGLLHKREDFIQGHLTALIEVVRSDPSFGGENAIDGVLGAYVLTCIIPDAFDQIDEETLVEIVRDQQNLGAISDLSQVRGKAGEGIWPNPNADKTDFAEEKRILEAINDKLRCLISQDTENSFLGVRAQFKTDADKGLISPYAINVEGLYRVIPMLFPSGPWLDRSLVCMDPGEPFPIELDRMESYCGLLKELILRKQISVTQDLTNFGLLWQVFHMLLPELQYDPANPVGFAKQLTRCLVSVPFAANKEESYTLFIVKKPGASEVELNRECLEKISDAIAHKDRLPDGENPEFLAAQKDWIGWQNHTWKEQLQEPHVSPETISTGLSDVIKKIMDQGDDIRALWLVKERVTYLPIEFSTTNRIPEDFCRTYLSFPSLWLFEKVNHILSEDNGLCLVSFGGEQGKRLHRYGYVNRLENGTAKVHITVGNNTSENVNLARALTFLGVRIANWQRDDRCQSTKISVSSEQAGKSGLTLSEGYKEYIKVLLRNIEANKLESIVRIFGERVGMIVVDNTSPIDHQIFLKGQSNGPISVQWRPVPTVQLELCCLNGHSILDAWRLEERWMNKEAPHDNATVSSGSFVLPDDCTFYYEKPYSGAAVKKLPAVSEALRAVAQEVNAGKIKRDILRHKEAVDTQKRLKKGWAHAMGNNLKFIRGLSELASERMVTLSTIKNGLNNTLFEEIELIIKKVIHETEETFENNRALFRSESEDAVFERHEQGTYSLKNACYNALRTILYGTLRGYWASEYKFDFVVKKYVFKIDPEDMIKKNADLVGFQRKKSLGEPLSATESEHMKKLEEETRSYIEKLSYYDSFMRNTLQEIESMLFGPEEIQENKIINLLSEPQEDQGSIKWFDNIKITIGDGFMTKNVVAWRCAVICFQEIWSNIFKYTTQDLNGNRNVNIRISCEENHAEFICENSYVNGSPFINKDGHFGLELINDLLPGILGYSREKGQNVKVTYVDSNGLFRIKFVREKL